MIEVAGTRTVKFCASSLVRTHAQSRADLESSRTRIPYIAGCEFAHAPVLRAGVPESKHRRSLAYAAANPRHNASHTDATAYPSLELAGTATCPKPLVACRPDSHSLHVRVPSITQF